MAPRRWLSCRMPKSRSPKHVDGKAVTGYVVRPWEVSDRGYSSQQSKEQDVALQANTREIAILREQLAWQEGKIITTEQNNKELQEKLTEMTRLVGELQGRIRELVAESPESKMAEMEAMREQIALENAEHYELNKKYNELQEAMKEAEKREGELRVDLHDLVEIQGNQALLLNEKTVKLDEARDQVEQQEQELKNRAEEMEKLKTKVWVAREYYEKGNQLSQEKKELQDKVSELQQQLEQSMSQPSPSKAREEVARLQGIIQKQDAQLRAADLELENVKRRGSGVCVSCSQLNTELQHLRKGHHELREEKLKLENELEELKTQLRRMSPYGGSPLGRIRELELQYTEKKQELCEMQHKLQAVESERDTLLEDLVAKEDQLLQQDGRLTMLRQALKQSEAQITKDKGAVYRED